ncbi:MAG: TldD/PmbA family protein [Deltaproteobacteria bacterium]|nr:TldD/PmbA family protein [Deltaproteobacteria bacterium]MBW2019482.1 TldD/PmbA family protein [Deltaproteobacteria bacterium]MBW2074319.1 TldD/PmbA family protein [Deltaproteobacteria bacterium]RLB82148.1 MAG: TldD/PmbA family protein [Deltaproteobacteria bacterium]
MTDISSIADSIMARLSHKGLDGYEAFMTCSRGLTIEIKDGVIDVFVTSENAGLSLRVLKGQRPGFAFSTDLSPEIVSDLIEQVVQGASVTDPDPFVGFPLPSSSPPPQLDQFDHDLQRIPVEEKIDRTRSLEAAARSSDPRIKKVRKAAYHETAGSITICNHTGLKLSYEKTLVSGSILVVAEDGGNAEIGWDYGFSSFFDQIDMASIGATAARRAVTMLGARSVKSRQAPAVLPPWVASDILKVLSASFTADNVQKGKSLLIGRMGKQVFSPHITIVDDGLYPGGLASSPFDDEGSPHERSVLVSEGVLQGFLYDQYTANKESRCSTGNAGRHGIKAPPSVQATNFYIQNGSLAPDELLSSLPEGLMVTDIIGLHTADPISGDFSVGAAGLWIKDGETVFPVKGIAISGNLIELFRNVDGVGTDLKFYGPFGSPSLRISTLNIAGPGV